ncbi:hypothetical protein [Phenylobacterium sp.]|uniref:hypothetical protein n=1 Tax=Phenylobacterium sp. TaxID=1871053 RepID=UPI002BA77FED|nr:hypothetical protein [Phenylobacterium sp.]HLZ75954.1 hypothetical protein [Phenylobacterium sp.]
MKAALLAAAIALLAGAAAAQTPAPPPTQIPGAEAPSAHVAAARPKAGGETVSGVTVMPLPTKACAARDKDCIAMVVAELKQRFPEELKRFCFEEHTKQARTQFVNDQLLDSLNSNNPPPPTSFQVSPVIKTACATDKK